MLPDIKMRKMLTPAELDEQQRQLQKHGFDEIGPSAGYPDCHALEKNPALVSFSGPTPGSPTFDSNPPPHFEAPFYQPMIGPQTPSRRSNLNQIVPIKHVTCQYTSYPKSDEFVLLDKSSKGILSKGPIVVQGDLPPQANGPW
eukprot:CAMPEP_0196588908 /NCGR_PEP_ID=MMETSP1081-20130531/62061_1 /TAXON_ID=36882 /ORGANISM="Pyramimonas amylifera, Strain CCMP720" /LENGTH=142 /DNA_ID=CAMNT_0041911549 /DNA_START=125 /DNA_END=550 /DNA_ORIENTATION=-